ncbi:MAG: SurA N-terminal domain-containing protein [Flavonifractor plautii]
MSASREKKSRQSDPTQGLTQKERKELQEQQAAKRKAVVYTVIGVIVAVLVAALLIWHSGIFQRGKTALTVGGRDYSVTDVNYYFTYYMNQAYSTSGGAFDPSKDLRTQYTDEEQTKSYFDQFLDSTIEQLKKISALETAASEAGYTLSDDDKAYVDEAISSTKKAAESYGYAYDGYLKAMYGKYMTPSAFKTCVEREALVNGYQSAYADSLGITDEDIQAYYEENASTLDTYDYRYIYLSGKAASTTDEDGNTVEPTEEETKAAMEAAKAKADAFVAAVNSSDDKETAFAELAPDYVSEDDKEDEADPDASLHTGTVGSSLSYQSFGKWLMDDSRANGDVGVVESSSGYYAVMLLNRYRDETATADIRHILIKAEVADADDPATEDVDESKVPTQEALDAAKAEAEDILAQWEAGDIAESFGALAEEYSDDPAQHQRPVSRSRPAHVRGLQRLILPTAAPSATPVCGDQDGQQGWHITYLEGWDEPVWSSPARTR